MPTVPRIDTRRLGARWDRTARWEYLSVTIPSSGHQPRLIPEERWRNPLPVFAAAATLVVGPFAKATGTARRDGSAAWSSGRNA